MTKWSVVTWLPDGDADADPGFHQARERVRRPQLPPARRGDRARRGRVGLRRGRQEVPGLPRGLLRREPGPLPPGHHEGDAGAGAQGDADVAGLPQRPAPATLQGSPRFDRLRHGAPDELGRRGGGDRREDGEEVGLQGQGHPRGPGGDHRLLEQLPRAHDHDRLLLDGRAVPRRFRAVHAGLQDRAVRRRPGGDRRHHAGYLRVHRGADPGRGRDRGAATRLPARDVGSLPEEQRAVRGRRDPVGSRSDRQALHLSARGDPAGFGDHRQGAVGGLLPRVRGAFLEGDSRRVQAGRPWQHLRRQPAGLCDRARLAQGAGGRQDGGAVGGAGAGTSWTACAPSPARTSGKYGDSGSGSASR